jgi:CMP-N,N'-diacetyllegionaminic acid synthase
MKILAVIPARGGSKRLPMKNIKILGGKPLISWSIESALGVPEINSVLVTTDDPKIATVAKKNGAYVPWLRPKELATDQSSSVDVVLHALDWFESSHGFVDGVLLLQPTSPFRTIETIKNGIELFKESGFKSILGVTKSIHNQYYSYTKQSDYLFPVKCDYGRDNNLQDLHETYKINGVLYLISPQELRLEHSFVTTSTIPLIIDSNMESIDIDTPWDFQVAELIYQKSLEW